MSADWSGLLLWLCCAGTGLAEVAALLQPRIQYDD